jgi:hypothetical protein
MFTFLFDEPGVKYIDALIQPELVFFKIPGSMSSPAT